MALVLGIQGPMTSSQCKQNMHKHTPIMQTSINKNDIQIQKIFFIENCKTFPIFRGFEQFSSSIGWLVGACHGIPHKPKQ